MKHTAKAKTLEKEVHEQQQIICIIQAVQPLVSATKNIIQKASQHHRHYLQKQHEMNEKHLDALAVPQTPYRDGSDDGTILHHSGDALPPNLPLKITYRRLWMATEIHVWMALVVDAFDHGFDGVRGALRP
eukprot:559950_1